MTIKSKLLLIILLTIVLVSCNKISPAGFWKNFKTEFIVKNISDQGPYGGHRAIYWKANLVATFNSQAVIAYAAKHRWRFIDSLQFTHNQVSRWKLGNSPVFPLSYNGFSDTVANNSVYEYFPRWINGQIKIYKFRTDWETIEPGTGNSTADNGFVVLNYEANEMSVYHLWGE